MTDYELFATKKDALARIKKMRGWPKAKAVRINLPSPEQPSWVIEAESSKTLRRDGYIR